MGWLNTLLSKLTGKEYQTDPPPPSLIKQASSSNQISVPEPSELPQAPNELVAVVNHFSQLLPALVGTVLAVLIAALGKEFPVIAIIGSFHCEHLIIILGLLSGFLFYDGVQKSYFSQSRNLTSMEPDARKEAFKGTDPLIYYEDERWRTVVDDYMDQARHYSRKAIWRLEIGSISLFYAIALIIFAYFFWLGLLAITLVTIYSITDINDIYTHVKTEKAERKALSQTK